MFDTISYVHHSDPAVRERDKTVFLLKPLSVGAMMTVSECYGRSEMGSGMSKVLEHGLVGWRNLVGDEGVVFQYDINSLSYIPVNVRVDLANAISKLSVLDEDQVDKLHTAARAMLLRSRAKTADEWECEKCSDINRRGRKCPFIATERRMGASLEHINPALIAPWDAKRIKKGKLPRWAEGNSHPYSICPIGTVSTDIQPLCGLVMDSINRDVMPVHPPVITEQPYIYQQARAIVVEEMNRIEEFYNKKDAKAEATSKTPQSILPRSKKWRPTKQ